MTGNGGLCQKPEYDLVQILRVLFSYLLAVHGLLTCARAQVNIGREGTATNLFGRETGNRTAAWVVRCATCGTFIVTVLTRYRT
jgi:hypothetical protein